ncbi:MAG: EAL domain-containing protein [Syntrophotaleaceae bacterium]
MSIPGGILLSIWTKTNVDPGIQTSLLLLIGSFQLLLVTFCILWGMRRLRTNLARPLRQQALIQKLIKDIPDHINLIDRDYRIHFSNWGRIYDYVPQEKRRNLARCYEVFYPGQDGPCETCHVRQVFETGKPVTRIKENPQIGFVEIQAFPVFDESGRVELVAERISDATARIRAENDLRASEEKLRVILHSIGDPIRVVNQNLDVIWANNSAEKTFGREILARKCCSLFEKAINRQQPFDCPTMAALKDGKSHEQLLEIEAVDGEVHFFKTASHVISWDKDHHPAEVLEVFWDVTRIKRAEKALRKSEMLFRTVVESSKDAMVAINPLGRITLFNPGAEKIFGRGQAEMLNAPVDLLLPESLRENHQEHIGQFFAGNGSGEAMGKTLELQALHSSGYIFPIELSLSWGNLGREKFVLAVIRDITERKLFEDQLIHQASHDELTGLPNRALLLERLSQAMAATANSGSHLAVVLLDLDKFKSVNDSLGHEAGNLLIREVALRLAAIVRQCDTVGRLYGDEFVILLENFADSKGISNLLQKLEQAFEKPFLIGNNQLMVTFSLGITVFPADGGENPEDLLKKADMAMYSCKETGKNSFSFFASAMEERLSQRLQLEKCLQKAVADNEFFLHYQPRVDSGTGQIAGVEALLRWTPDPGPVSPNLFVPILEETGRILEVGRWVLHKACQTAQAWQEKGFTPLRVWVNVSARQFLEKDFFEKVERVLLETGLRAEWLGLELTETVLMQDVEVHIDKLKRLKRLGLLISIDDFGTGYSSLSYLKRFPIDEIKIDRSFVSGLMTDENDTAIVRTILAMAKSLGLRTVAEGVETRSQVELLQRLQCEEMQGYLFSRPLPPEELEKLLASGPLEIMGPDGNSAA